MHVTVSLIERKTRLVRLIPVEIHEGATAEQVARAARLEPEHIEAFAVFSRKVSADAPLKEGDRLDISAKLLIDPMTARRLREQNRHATSIPKPRHGGKHQLIKPLDN